MSLSMYDGVMLAIVLYSIFHGAMKGMAWQLAPIASLILGYLFAVPLSAVTAQWFGEPPLNRAFAMVTMYMLVSLGVYLIARSLRESLEKTKLLEFDRHLGALLGGVKGVLFTVVVTIALLSVSPSAAHLIVHSESRTVAENVIHYVEPLLPDDMRQVIDPYLKPIENLPDVSTDSIAKGKTTSQANDIAVPDNQTPRSSRHHHRHKRAPIFADDTSTENSPGISTDTTRRRKSNSESNPDSQNSPDPNESDDTAFGANPNNDAADPFR